MKPTVDYSLLLKSAKKDVEEAARGYAETLETLLSIDVSTMNGRGLRKLRDQIMGCQIAAAAASDKGRRMIAAETDAVGRPLREDEIFRLAARFQRPIRFALG
jgi:hypothetical protein